MTVVWIAGGTVGGVFLSAVGYGIWYFCKYVNDDEGDDE